MNEDILALLNKRYFLTNETEWAQIAKRVSKPYPAIQIYIENMTYIPSTPTLLNCNTNGERLGTLSSCFPMDIHDSIDGIFESLKEAAKVTKMGGGVGYDFGKLRSSVEIVGTINRESSGPLPFIDNFNTMLDGIQQGGVRRGAGMALMSIYHPDIIQFIKAKSKVDAFARLNFSVKIPDSFYKDLKHSPNKIHQVNLISKPDKWIDLEYEGKKVTIKELWNMINHYAWKHAEPGIFNESIAYNQCTVTNYSDTVICNPCAEFVNIPYASCNLGSINLSNLVINGVFDWEEHGRVIDAAVRHLNGILDANEFPIPNIKKVTKAIRPIGLGIMGLAHALFKMGLAYGSEAAIEFTEEVARYQTLRAMKTSALMAKENGAPYEAYDEDLFFQANKRFFNRKKCRDIDVEELVKKIEKYGVYNSCFTSIAPTGSISTIANTSGGIEPIFALLYTRKVEKLNHEYDLMYISDPVFKEYILAKYPDKAAEILKEVAENKGSCYNVKILTAEERRIFATAPEISPIRHLEMLAAAATNTSLSASKTINLPADIPEDKLSDIYLKAHEMGIIGVTIYRDGSREGVLIHEDKIPHIDRKWAPVRPESLECDAHTITVTVDPKEEGEEPTKETFVILVGKLNGSLYEMFVTKDNKGKLDLEKHDGYTIKKAGKSFYNLMLGEEVVIENLSKVFKGIYGAMARLISMSLRHGTPLEFVVDQLNKNSMVFEPTFDRVVSRVLKKYIKDGEIVRSGESCPDCGSKLVFKEGCKACSACDWSKCG